MNFITKNKIKNQGTSSICLDYHPKGQTINKAPIDSSLQKKILKGLNQGKI